MEKSGKKNGKLKEEEEELEESIKGKNGFVFTVMSFGMVYGMVL